MTIEELYEQRWHQACAAPFPDIFEHLPTLRRYAEKVAHITEIGTRGGNSTTGFLMGLARHGGQMHSYDRDPTPFATICPRIEGVSWFFHQFNTQTHQCQIEPTDLLFIDGDHSYIGVCMDLRFAPLARRYIIMHDTSEAWARGDGGRGVFEAKSDFLKLHNEWCIAEEFDNCNGLTVLKRVE